MSKPLFDFFGNSDNYVVITMPFALAVALILSLDAAKMYCEYDRKWHRLCPPLDSLSRADDLDA